jgi:hypothetical protein
VSFQTKEIMKIVVSVAYADIKPLNAEFDVLKVVHTPRILTPLTMKGCFLPWWFHVHTAIILSIICPVKKKMI